MFPFARFSAHGRGRLAMAEAFRGRWRLLCTGKNAGFDERFRVTGADSGNGTYDGVPGVTVDVSGANWTVTLEWNDNQGSGWQESAVQRVGGFLNPIVQTQDLRADDNFPALRDGDFDDLIVRAEQLDPIFDVV